jgi:hypothetical protein
MMDIEDALNLGLPPYRIEKLDTGDDPRRRFRAELPGYPQCTGFGATSEEALRVVRHLFTQLRDGQTAVAVSDLQDDTSDRLKEAMRIVVTRALV